MMTLVGNLSLFVDCPTRIFVSVLYFSPLRVSSPERARLEELKESLSSPSARASAQRMYPADFEKVREARWEKPQTGWRLRVRTDHHPPPSGVPR